MHYDPKIRPYDLECHFLNYGKLGAVTTSLGSLLQSPSNLPAKNLFLIPNLNLPQRRKFMRYKPSPQSSLGVLGGAQTSSSHPQRSSEMESMLPKAFVSSDGRNLLSLYKPATARGLTPDSTPYFGYFNPSHVLTPVSFFWWWAVR